MSILDSLKKIFTGERSPTTTAAINPDPAPKKSSEQYYIAGIKEDRAMKDRFFRMDPTALLKTGWISSDWTTTPPTRPTATP